MDCEDYKYFGFYQYYLGEFEEVWDDPEDPTLTCIRHEFHFKVGTYYIIIYPYGSHEFEYEVQNDNQVLFNSNDYFEHPSYDNVSNMIQYYQALQDGEDASSIITKLFTPHARILNGETPKKKQDILTLSSLEDLQEAINALAEEMGISPESPISPD